MKKESPLWNWAASAAVIGSLPALIHNTRTIFHTAPEVWQMSKTIGILELCIHVYYPTILWVGICHMAIPLTPKQRFLTIFASCLAINLVIFKL